ncbi:MAG: DUF4886 domain-containing protein [Bacteroidales bacterium]|nr:DUF4886 domain-containing protein [Bacteroidales bacterium]
MKHILLFFALTFLGIASIHAQNDTLRVLSVANSFGVDAVEQNLHEIALADSHVLIIGNLYIGGCSLERHYNNAVSGEKAYSYRKISADGTFTTVENASLPQAFADEPWDVVVFQQVSQYSGKVETYEPYLGKLLQYATQHSPNGVRLYLHQTWAYSKDSTHPNFPDYNCNQEFMYRELCKAYKSMADKYHLGVIPSGTAVQNARKTYLGDTLTRDGFHLSYGLGRYLAAATYYAALYQTKVSGNGWMPPQLDPREVETARRCADAAVRKPFATSCMCRDYRR